ncbi:MAG: branched-chain amino acid ABC transporter permease [Burkholderiales bacterium]
MPPSDFRVNVRKRANWRWIELLPWICFVAFYFLFESRLALGNTVLIMVLFTLSLDLVMGYTGVATLGHAAFYGVGAYAAGLLTVAGWGEPISGLVLAGFAGAILAVVTGLMLLHLHGNTLLMLTLAILMMLYEGANKWTRVTGGDDGLQGVAAAPIFGLFEFDLRGHTRYWYALIVLFALFLICRRIVHSQFGLALIGIRENTNRMRAIGAPVRRHLVVIYTIAGAMAGVAGGLSAHSTGFVGLDVLGIALAANVLVMLVLGGAGRLYGAIVGAVAYVVLHHFASNLNPFHWMFVVGFALILVVRFGRGGILGLLDRTLALIRARMNRT